MHSRSWATLSNGLACRWRSGTLRWCSFRVREALDSIVPVADATDVAAAAERLRELPLDLAIPPPPLPQSISSRSASTLPSTLSRRRRCAAGPLCLSTSRSCETGHDLVLSLAVEHLSPVNLPQERMERYHKRVSDAISASQGAPVRRIDRPLTASLVRGALRALHKRWWRKRDDANDASDARAPSGRLP